jgi:glycosyltransferase involved in cell wall biosynthesis
MRRVTPECTIIIPTHDRRELLARTLASALGQRSAAFEVIVVDDGSSDGTAEWLAGQDDPRLRWRRQEAAGVSHARNRGLALAEGTWVLFLDDDDLLAPLAVRRLVDAATAADAALAWSASFVVDLDGTPIAVEPVAPVDGVEARLLRTNVVGSPSRVLVRREAALAAGGFDPELSVMADWEFWIRVLRHGPGAGTPQALVALTHHGDNMQVSMHAQIKRELAYIRERHGARAAELGVPQIGDVALQRWIAHRHKLAGRRLESARLYVRVARCPGGGVLDAARALSALARAERVHRRLWRPRRPPAPHWISPLVTAAAPAPALPVRAGR